MTRLHDGLSLARWLRAAGETFASAEDFLARSRFDAPGCILLDAHARTQRSRITAGARMYQRSKLPVVGKPAIPKWSARHERPSKPVSLNLAEWSAIAAASASRAFNELLSAFNRKLGEISGDRVRIHLPNLGDRPRVRRVPSARLRSKRVDREGCR